MKYILMLNPEESNKISISYDFIGSILQDFDVKKLELEEVKEEESIYSHIFSFQNGFFEMFLNKNKGAVTLEGDWEKTINFVIAFIKQLPDGQKVHFFDESYSDNMIIDSSTTIKDIESTFVY